MKDVSISYKTLKNGKKSWSYRIELAKIDGKRHQTGKSGFSTKTEARKAGFEALKLYENAGTIVSASEMSYSDFLDMWMDNDCKMDLKQETIKNYTKKIENHIKPALGQYRLRSIGYENIQDFITEMFNKGYSRNTLFSLIGIISKSLKWAVTHHYLRSSPAVEIKIPKYATPKTPTRSSKSEYISHASIEKIFERFPETHPSHIPLKIGYECGMRIGEVFALVWEDIDLDNKTLTVNRQVQWHEDKMRTENEKQSANGKADCGNGYWYFTNPKYNSFRVIDLSDDLVDLLKREKERQLSSQEIYGEYYAHYYAEHPLSFKCKENDIKSPNNPVRQDGKYPIHFVNVRKYGEYVSSRTMQHTTSVIKSIITENFKFHDLRHTHITDLYAKNVDETLIVNRLGHSNVSMTREYKLLNDEVRTNGMQIINDFYCNKCS